MSGWGAALRIARRDAVRSKGRSLLVLVMIALPVLGVTAADVLFRTSEVTGAEALEWRLGAADARVTVQPGASVVVQDVDPDENHWTESTGKQVTGEPGLDEVGAVLGGEVRALEYREGSTRVRTARGFTTAESVEVDLADPLTAGLFELTSGRWPSGAGEVVLNGDLAGRGLAVGDEVRTGKGQSRDVVGTMESPSARNYPIIAGPPGSLGLEERRGERSWLIEAGPVTWDEVRALNALGATVLSRAVLHDPPPDSEVAPEILASSAVAQEDFAVFVLVVVMALLEVVLLAGPAFAVGARRQSRLLAMMAAQGASPAQARRVVLAGGVVLGGVATAVAVVGGIASAWLLVPVVDHWSDSRMGPFDVPWLEVAGIATFGLVSAVLAALVPAWLASRQDVVAVLAGRRGERPAGVRFPLLGVALLALGVMGAAHGAQRRGGGEYVIAAAAVVVVLGMILVVPVVLGVLARISRWLPLSLRYAVRDASRHRARTVPAVAAVAATVCGVVAMGIATSSDQAQAEAEHVPLLPDGAASVSTQRGWQTDWDALGEAAAGVLPGARVTPVQAVAPPARAAASWLDLRRVGKAGDDGIIRLDMWGSVLGADHFVSDGTWPVALRDGAEVDTAEAERTLAAGGVVVFTSDEMADRSVRITATTGPRGDRSVTAGTFPAYFVKVPNSHALGRSVLAREVAEALGVPVGTVGLYIDGVVVDERRERDLATAASAVDRRSDVFVERGFEETSEGVVVQLVIGGLGAVLMLGGTLTATFLALSDARGDLATLAAVGASPRRRRGVAAAYALVIGVVGALLGVLAGLVPGIAVTYPLTGDTWLTGNIDGEPLPDHFLAFPWLLIGLVVLGLPVFTAAVVGLTARSRLPLATRLD